MLLAGADGHEETRVALEGVAHRIREEQLQVQRLGHILIGCGIAAVAAGEWLHGAGGAALWAWTAGVAGAGAVAIAASALWGEWRRRPRLRNAAAAAAAVLSLSLGAVLVAGALRVRRIECCWAAERERLVTRASERLDATLRRAVTEARRLAERGATAALLPDEERFTRLQEAVRDGPAGLERGVVILAPNGDPLAWAGRHRLVPTNDTAELRADITPFYVSLHARRQTRGDGSAIGTVLLYAAPVAPDSEEALSVAFTRSTGVALRFYAPSIATHDSDVFEFCPVKCDRTAARLFSVRPQPPEQGGAKLRTLRVTARVAAVLLVTALLLLLCAAPPGASRWSVLITGVWVVVRASVGLPVPFSSYFSPATFFRPVLEVAHVSAGSLSAVSGVLLLLAAALWRRGGVGGTGRGGTVGRPRWWQPGVAIVLLVVAPYLVRYFGRGITPPAGSVGFGLWLSWEAALALVSMALVVLAAALVRGPAEPRRVPWTVPAACVWAVIAGAAGLWLWQPYGAWPGWYTWVWLPALAGVIVPAPRRWALAGIATVAGTAAALVTWEAGVEGRISLAMRDAQRLGHEGDAVAVAKLERFGLELTTGASLLPPPRSAGDLYALWLRSPLAEDEYPVVLGLWSRTGRRLAELRLAALEGLSPSLLAALVRSAVDTAGFRVERLERIPGVHYVLVARLASGNRVTVGVGPRSRAMLPDRVARFLRGERVAQPPYTILLSLPNPSGPLPPADLEWSRVGWEARGDRSVELPGGVRHVHVRVDLRDPVALLVRGALVVLVDVALLGSAWLLLLFVSAGEWSRPPSLAAAFRSSYRVRLSAALAAFFVLPMLAFAAWSYARLREDARQDGDLLIRQTLRDAAATAGQMNLERPTVLDSAIMDLGQQLDADLWLYRAGRLAGTSAPVLDELGLVDPFLAPPVFERLAFEDELEATANDRTAGRPIRVGYKVVRAGPPDRLGVLAAPQLLDDERVRQQEEDLALALMLTTAAGLLAAVTLAGLAARTLARPVAALREAALAVGRGAALPPFPPGAPREFEPVLSAFERMAADVRRSQAALEEARQRTAQVLANVATGVMAVDPELRVTMANPRAEELLGSSLEPGDILTRATNVVWAPVWEAVQAFAAAPARPPEIVDREFEIAGRQIRVQLASLGPSPDGCVVALDDATALTRAARVLAWGEMARQVAHEIKNPLTPIRLGIQHLQRAREVRGGERAGASSKGARDFDATLQETSERILAEIDRLDAIARAFSRFGAPAAEQAPLEPVNLLVAAREVVQLYALGRTGGGASEREMDLTVTGEAGRPASARKDEVKEVLVNLLENARNAGARTVTVRISDGGLRLDVEDDGRGVPPESLPRVFEPTFSTTSSGSGLGLAIAKRLVESWGGTITLTSQIGRGATVTIAFRDAAK
jgi:signal transduction histidine kinase